MLQKILDDVSLVERIRILQTNAVDVVERYEYERDFTEEDLDDLRLEFAQQQIEILKIEEEKAKIIVELNEKLKPLKKRTTATLENLRTGRERVVERVFVLENADTNELGTYNAEGLLLAVTKQKKGGKRALPFNTIGLDELGQVG